MLSKEVCIVLQHYLDQGLSKTAIAQKLGIDRRTVARHAASRVTEPRYGPRRPKPSKLDPFKAYLAGRLATYPELSVVRLLAELRERSYDGGYSILKAYLQKVRPTPPAPFEVRFEVAPGEQAQVDFAHFTTPFGPVVALLVVLSWSRTLYVRFSLHQDQLTFLGGLHQAFIAFGGVPRTLLFDRMRTAVAGTEADGSARFNAELLRFAGCYGFRPVACRPYRAQTKGRVERAVSYLRQSFFYGRSFHDLDDLNAQCAGWLAETANQRRHGTTGAIPAERLVEERPHLQPLPSVPYIPLITVGRRTTRDGFVSYNGNAYSVPDGTGRSGIELYATLTELRLVEAGTVIATHALALGRGQRILQPGHRQQRRSGWESPATAEPREVMEVERRPLDIYEQVLR